MATSIMGPRPSCGDVVVVSFACSVAMYALHAECVCFGIVQIHCCWLVGCWSRDPNFIFKKQEWTDLPRGGLSMDHARSILKFRPPWRTKAKFHQEVPCQSKRMPAEAAVVVQMLLQMLVVQPAS